MCNQAALSLATVLLGVSLEPFSGTFSAIHAGATRPAGQGFVHG